MGRKPEKRYAFIQENAKFRPRSRRLNGLRRLTKCARLM